MDAALGWRWNVHMADVLEHLATNVKVVDVCRGTVLVLGSRSLEAGLVVL